jgi:hypothetical protein
VALASPGVALRGYHSVVAALVAWARRGTHSALEKHQEGGVEMYSILYIIGAIVVIIVVLRLLGLY